MMTPDQKLQKQNELTEAFNRHEQELAKKAEIKARLAKSTLPHNQSKVTLTPTPHLDLVSNICAKICQGLMVSGVFIWILSL